MVVQVSRRPRTASELVDGTRRLELLRTLQEIEAPAPLPIPEAWNVVRSVAFGVVDGGDFGGSLGGKELVQHRQRAVLDDRRLVAIDPAAADLEFSLSSDELATLGVEAEEGAVLRGHDVVSAQLLKRTMADGIDEPRTETEASRGRRRRSRGAQTVRCSAATAFRHVARFTPDNAFVAARGTRRSRAGPSVGRL